MRDEDQMGMNRKCGSKCAQLENSGYERESRAGVTKGFSFFKRMREIGTCLFLRRNRK